MWQPGRPYQEAYHRPIDAGIKNGHLVFFIHGGLNDLAGVIERVLRFSKEFETERWHLIHLAWDTSWGSGWDAVIRRGLTRRFWRSLSTLPSLLLPWNWLQLARALRGPTAYFGGIMWKSQYATARAALRSPGSRSHARERGFYRAFKYLNEAVVENDGVQISFVVHSAGSIVANYLLDLVSTEFTNLTNRVKIYILLAPACHVTQVQKSLSNIQMGNQAVVFALTPELERADSIIVQDKSLLWAIHDLFEAKWSHRDFNRFRIPIEPKASLRDPWNRGLLGLEELVAALEKRVSKPIDRSFGGKLRWAHSNEVVSLAGMNRAWTESTRHGDFDDDGTTLESIRILLK